MLTKEDIKKLIPHREPMLMIDEITDYVLGKSATGVKYLSPDEEFFKGHFPGFPVMPGVLTIESISQVGAVLMALTPEFTGRICFFTGIDELKFKRKIVPGETITIKVELLEFKGRFGVIDGKAYVGDELAASGKLTFFIGEKPQDQQA